MSVATAKAALKQVLAGITSAGPLVKIYDNPKEATSIAEFPCVILALAPGVPHTISQETAGSFGLLRHDYMLRCYLFVGQRQSSINELTARCEPWPEAIGVALADNLTLNGAVDHIGDLDDRLATYIEGPIAWGLTPNEPAFYGLKIDLPVTELISAPMEP